MDLFKEIKSIEKDQIQDVLQAVIARWRELYPNWDINILSLDKGEDINTQLDRVIALAEKLKE